MSDAISALQGRTTLGEVTIREGGLRGMITLRGDLSDAALRAVCKKITGQAFPDKGKITVDREAGIAWMSPDEVLVMVPYAQVTDAVAQIDAALAGQHYLAENVSDARALIHVEGAFAREVMAKLTPADLHPESFGAGDFRRSHLGQVAAAFWMVEADTFAVICFRSVADYVHDLLVASAKAGPVGMF
ncbi:MULTISPECIES: sarcosine oxidase subunit gamma [unclassified Yoonia]|uniref:sarcosine oxidase subunit gamma n=1 Tax=unclassified Yoonia TaxID=2629118 RepID=UPI002AFEAA05|nr:MULTISPECIES: sarcosine oxidase subunit gamma family protein [unclassified Yoonia]